MKMISTVGLLALAWTGVAHAVTIPGVGSGSAKIVFLDKAGRPERGLVLDASGLFPGMAPRKSLITIQNAGAAPADFELTLVEANRGSGPCLADALYVTVTESTTGARLYRGTLSGLRFAARSVLNPGRVQRITLVLSWPDGGSADQQYMGASSAFSLVVRAWSA